MDAVGACRITRNRICAASSLNAFLALSAPKNLQLLDLRLKAEDFFLQGDQNMDNWKIQLVVMTLCALVQTYQAVSSGGDEGRGLPQDWQVSLRSSEIRENMDNKIW